MDSLQQRVQAVMGVWRDATQSSQHDPLHKSVAQKHDAAEKAPAGHKGSGIQRLERLLVLLQKHDLAGAQPVVSVPQGQSTIHFRPFSLQDFQERLRSFSSIKWYFKPQELAAFACARHGWYCVKTDELQCKVCDSVYHHKSLPGSASSDARQTDAAQGKAKLVQAHAKDCPWRVTHSPESFCQLQPAPGAALLKHAETALASMAPLYPPGESALPALEIDPLFHSDASGVLRELVSIARACKALPQLPLLSAQLAALAQAQPGDTSAAVRTAVTKGQALLLAATGWALVPPPPATAAKRQRGDDSPGSDTPPHLLCATCQATVALRPSDQGPADAGNKRARSVHATDVGSTSFRDAALRAVRASDSAVASATGAGSVDSATPASTPDKTAQETTSTSASLQASPLSTSLAREFSPPGSAGTAHGTASRYGTVHPLLAHRSSCPWVTRQTMQRHRRKPCDVAPRPAAAQLAVSQLGEASLRAVETVAALSAGGAVPAANGNTASVRTVSKPGWQLYVDALCDSLLE